MRSGLPSSASLNWLAVALALAWLQPFRLEPMPTFYSEWLCAVGVLMAALWRLRAPELVVAPAAGFGVVAPLRWSAASLWLWVVVLVGCGQWLMNRLPYAENLLHAAVFALAWCATVQQVFVERERRGLVAAWMPLALACVWGSAITTVLQSIQFFGRPDTLDPWVFGLNALPNTRPSGNLAQPNHTASLHGVALAMLGWLYAQGHWGRRRMAGLVLLTALGLALTASRTGLLFLPWLAGMAWLVGLDLDLTKRRALLFWACVVLPAVTLGLTLLLPVWQSALMLEAPALYLTQAGSLVERTREWAVAWQAALERPWLGYGVGQFSEAFFEQLPHMPFALPWARHAHNWVLHWLAEMGLVLGGAILLGMLWHFVHAMRSQARDATRLAAVAVLGVLVIHNLTEYPLWHLYFLLVAAWAVGMLDSVAIPVQMSPAALRTGVLVFCLAGFGLAAWAVQDFWQASQRLQVYFEKDTAPAYPRSSSGGWFASLHDFLDDAGHPLVLPLSAEALEKRRKATARRPYPNALMDLMLAESVAGDQAQAERLAKLYRQLYPDRDAVGQQKLNNLCTQTNHPGLCRLATAWPQLLPKYSQSN